MAHVTAVSVEHLGPGSYRVRAQFDPPPLATSPLSPAPLLATLRDAAWPEYGYQSPPAAAFVAAGPGGESFLYADFSFDDSTYYLAEWEVPAGHGLAFPDGSVVGEPLAGAFPYTAPLTSGVLAASWFGGRTGIEAAYSEPPGGGRRPYLLYQFALFVSPSFDTLDFGTSAGPWYEFGVSHLATALAGRSVVAAGQVTDSDWNYSDWAFSGPLTFPSLPHPPRTLSLALSLR